MRQLELGLPPVKTDLFYHMSGMTTCATCNKVIPQNNMTKLGDEHFCSSACAEQYGEEHDEV